MGRRRKWRWKEVVPYSTCTCFGRKEWEAIVEDEPEAEGSPRRGGISFDQTDKNARYIRSGAEVKVVTKPELAHGYLHAEREQPQHRSSLLQEQDLNILDKLDNSQYRTKCGLRFLSLHRVRRRPRPALKCTRDNASILDVQYMDQAGRLLSTVGEWDFNMFTLNKLTNGRALFHTSLHLFQEHNLVEIFKLDIVKLMRFISLVEEGYHSSNPYHNAVHAADVAQAMHCYLIEPKLNKSLSPLEKLAALVSAITHDLDHPGVNQAFLIATSNHLATLYNNTSVLENHHWRSAIGLLHESGVFDHFDDSLWKTMEWQLKSLILATDITRQPEFLSRFKSQLDQNNLNLIDIEHKNFIMQIALKCADICNPCRPWEVSKRWSELVCDEFFKQGDCERQLNLPVTPLCDRMSTTVAKIQTGFMKYVVTPLFTEWYRFNPTSLSELMLTNISANHNNWDRIDQEAELQKKKQEQGTLPEEEEEDEDENSEEDTDVDTSSGNHQLQTTVVVIEKEPVIDSFQDEDKENTEPSESPPDTAAAEELATEDCLLPLCLYRRHSLPPPLITGRDGLSLLPSRRDSLPRSMSRRYSLPVGNMPNSNSFDKLVEKLSSLVECSPTNGTHFDYDQRPKMVSVSQSLDAKTLSNAALEASKQTSAHGLDPALLAHRQYMSEPHISALLAHQYKNNNRYSSFDKHLSGLLQPRLQHATASTTSSSASQSPSSCPPTQQKTAVSLSHPSLPSLSMSVSGVPRSSHVRPISGAAPTQPLVPPGTTTQPPICNLTPSIDCKNSVRGPRRSLGDTSLIRCGTGDSLPVHDRQGPRRSLGDTSSLTRCVTGDCLPAPDRQPLLLTTYSVDAICPSGVDTADRLSSESPNHSSMTHSSLHKAVTMESHETKAVTMATNKLQSSSEEETPLLHDLMRLNEGSTKQDMHHSHANDSFTH